MRTEIYSVRSNADELQSLSLNFRYTVKALDERASIRVLFKTEIDSNPGKIKKEFFSTLKADNPPEFYIYANALDTIDSSSFRRLFTPIIKVVEKELEKASYLYIDKKSGQQLHLVVTPIWVEGEAYPSYCFTVSGKKVLVLPRMKFVSKNYTDYIVEAVNKSKDVFLTRIEQNSQGYIISDPVKPTSKTPDSTIKEDTSETATPALGTSAESTSSELTPPSDEKADIQPAVDNGLSPEPVTAQLSPEPQTESCENLSVDNISPEPQEVNDESEKIPEEIPEDMGNSEKASAETLSSNDASQNEEGTPTEDTDSTDEKTPEEESADISEEPKKKRGFKKFIMSFIPHKGDSVKNIILKIVVLLAIVAFLVGGALLLKFYVIEPAIFKADMKEIQDIHYQEPETVTVIDDEGNTVEVVAVRNWAGDKKINEEIVGWVKIDNTVIDYPVLEHKGDDENNQFYLYKNHKKEYSEHGSIFVDYRCNQSVKSQNVILHGHNMGSDQTMFANLTKYPGNIDFYKSAPVVHFDTPEANGDYVIFSVIKVNVSNENNAIFNYLIGEFSSSAQRMNFIYNLKELSYLNVDIPINETDQLLTLSTCSYERENMRTVVIARKLREGEDISRYVEKAEKKDPAYSISSSFSQEYEAKNTPWYDGGGKLEGDESLPYMEQGDMYTVKFLDADGKAISTQQVLKGKNAKAPEDKPGKAPSGGYYYVFKGWDKSFKNVQKDLTVKPVYTKKAMPPVQPVTYPTDSPEEDAQYAAEEAAAAEAAEQTPEADNAPN